MTTENTVSTDMRFASTSSPTRRFVRPVRLSVLACNCERSKARNVPMRLPACTPSAVSCAICSGFGGLPLAPATCNTPSARPMKLTGTQAADIAPPMRSNNLGQALSASASGKICG